MYDRIIDNSKVLEVTGLKQSDFMSLYDGLKLELSNLPRDTVWERDLEVFARMDEYIEKHGL